jgi:hypothetical protein
VLDGARCAADKRVLLPTGEQERGPTGHARARGIMVPPATRIPPPVLQVAATIRRRRQARAAADTRSASARRYPVGGPVVAVAAAELE